MSFGEDNVNVSTTLASTLVVTTTSTIPHEIDTQTIFFQTAAARGISGFFVIMALLITCHQVLFSFKNLTLQTYN